VLAALGGLGGLMGLYVALQYVLGMTGGLWAALVMSHAARNTRSRPLLIASAAMALYALVNGITVPRYAAATPNNQAFQTITCFPI
jgi:hypothetical protein